MGNRIHHREAASVQIFLHVGDDHVSFAYQNPVSSHQFQILIKDRLCRLALLTSQPSISTGVNTATGAISPVLRCPFDVLQQALMQVIFKLIGQTVLIVMSGAAAALGIGDVVKRNHDTVNGDIFVSGILPQLIDTGFHISSVSFCFVTRYLQGWNPNARNSRSLI